MRFLLDTNVISEVRKGPRCDPNVSSWYSGVEESQIHLSALTIGEIRRGIELIQRHDVEQAKVLNSWLEEVMNRFSARILAVDAQVADTWGKLSAIRPVPVTDGILAATAMVHDLTLVTRNVSDVAGLGVQVLNPFLRDQNL